MSGPSELVPGGPFDSPDGTPSGVPSGLAQGGPTSTGVDPQVASMLCYAAWWVTGLLFLFLERQHRGVRFHAAQSLVLFGGLSLLMACLGAASGSTLLGAVGGVVGAGLGTLGGAALRARLAAQFGADRPAALIEDAVAILGALVIVNTAA